MIEPINKAGNVFEGGALLVAQADPKCWVREGYTVVKSSELEQLRAELEQAKNRIYELESGYVFDPSQSDIRISGTLNKIKADVIEAATNATKIDIEAKDEDGKTLWIGFKVACPVDSLKEYAEKVRRGEV